MNDIRRPGRPSTKHLNKEHHFKMTEHTNEDDEPIAVDSMIHDIFLEAEDLPIVVEKMVEQIVSEIDSQDDPIIEGDLKRSIKTVPNDGKPVFLFASLDDRGTLAFRKKTRVLNPKAKKWEIAERWYEHLTGFPIDFDPMYWQEKL